ncbi:MAG TPA: GNAT family N-acetyltransferase [Dehalococcoidales bacterium]
MTILRSTPEFLPREVVVAEELIDAFLSSPQESGYYILVAETDGKVAGYICYGETPLTEGTWDIYWIAVDRTRRGMGIGGALMKKAESKIRESKGRLAVIETSSKPDYNETRQFHTSQGYTEIALIPDFYAVGDSKVIMVKRLG